MKSPEKNLDISQRVKKNVFVVDLRSLPNEIREETDDRITIVENIPAGEKILTNLMGFFLLWFVVNSYYSSYSSTNYVHVPMALFYGILIIFLLVGGLLIFSGIRMLMVSYSVTLDKKSQRIIIKKDSNINLLKSIKEMPFSDINRIETERHVDSDGGHTWRVNLIKIQGGSTKIYETYYESDAGILAEKIRKITNRKITLK